MTINLSAEMEAVVVDEAKRLGTTPEQLIEQTLRERLAPAVRVEAIKPRDDWERRLLSIARPTGVSHSNEELSSEGLYD